MAVTIMNAEIRDVAGTGPARSVRTEKKVPGVVYGKGMKEMMVAVDEKLLTQMYHKEGFMSHLIELHTDKNKLKVLPRDIQLHPVTDRILHVDFMFVKEGSTVNVHVPIHFKNEDICIGIKRGGVLNFVNRDVELVCNVESIPEFITVDLTTADIGHSLHLSMIDLPKGAVPASDKDLTIVTVVGRAAEEEAPKAAGTDISAGAPAAAPAKTEAAKPAAKK